MTRPETADLTSPEVASVLPQRISAVFARAGVATAAFWTVLGVLYVTLTINLSRTLSIANLADFDESRHAVNAYEMLKSGNWIVNTYLGNVDYWNLKPPLSFWTVMLSYDVFGFTPFALRFPSMLAMLATTAVVTWYALRRGGRAAALGTTAAMVGCYPLIIQHAGTSGDPDALFVLFITIGLVAVFESVEKPWAIGLATLGFSLAFLTKSFHAGIIIVVALIFLVLQRRRLAYRPRHALYAAAGLIPLVAWAAARASFDGTEFFTSMVSYDLLARSSTAIEGHSGSRIYYIELLQNRYGPWLILLAAAAVGAAAAYGASSRDSLLRPRSLPLWVGPLVWALVIQIAFGLVSTKIAWYVNGSYPAIALLIGFLLQAAVRDRSRAVRITLAGVAVYATLMGVNLVNDSLNERAPMPAQVTLSELQRDPEYAGATIYLGDGIAQADQLATGAPATALAGDWPQSLTASAELYGDLGTADGGVDAFLASSGDRALILVKTGSAADAALGGIPVTRVAEYRDFYIAER